MRVRMLAIATATTIAAALVAAGCGSDDGGSTSKDSKSTKAATPSVSFGESTLVAEGGSDPDLAFTPDGTVLLSWVQPSGTDAKAMDHDSMDSMDHGDSGDDSSHAEDAVDTGGSRTVMVDHGDDHAEGEDADHAEGEGHDDMEMEETKFDVYVARSDDGGESFGAPVRVNAVAGDVYSGANTQPKVTVVDDERVLVSWTSHHDYPGQDYGQYTVRVAQSTDGGKTFDKPNDLLSTKSEGEVTSESYQELHALEDGTVVAAFLDYRGSFRKPASDAIGLRTTTWKQGEAWFGKSIQVDEMTCECCDNALTVNEDGKLLLAFRDQVAGSGGEKPDRDSAVRMSDDDGATWSDAVKLGNDGWKFDQCPESGPDLAVDGDGTVHGVYYTGKDGRPGVYHSWSEDGGASFDSAKLATDDEFFPPASMDLAPLDSGAVIAWDDQREKDAKIGYAVITGDGDVEPKPGLASGTRPSVASLDGHVLLAWVGEKGIELASSGHHDHGGAASGSSGDDSSGEDSGSDADVSESVEVVKGAIKGGPIQIKASKGDTVQLKVTSDEAVEIHVHGFDVSRDIPAGGSGTVSFTADEQGSFEIELEDTSTLIATLEVR